MNSKKKYSLVSARNTLKIFFEGRNSVTPEEIFQITDRTGNSEKSNAEYLYNKLTLLRHFGFINTVKKADEDGVFRIAKVSLTKAGKDLLASAGTPDKPAEVASRIPPAKNPRQITLQSITDDVDEFNRQNPSWEIELVPKRIRKEAVSQEE